MLLWMGVWCQGNAQPQKADSLYGILAQAEADTSRIRLTNEWAKALFEFDIDSAKKVIKPAIQLAQDLHDEHGLYDLYTTLSLCYEEKDQADSQAMVLNTLLELPLVLKDTEKRISVLRSLANAHQFVNLNSEAIAVLKQAYELAKSIEHEEHRFRCLNRMGTLNTKIGEYDTADHYLNQALSRQQRLGNKSYQIGVLQNLGNNASQGNRLEIALAYYKRARVICKEIDNKGWEALILQMMAYSCTIVGNYPLALEYTQFAINIHEAMGREREIMGCKEELANIYLSMGNNAKAITFWEEVVAYWEAKDGDNSGVLNKKGQLAILKKAYPQAISLYKQILERRARQNILGHEPDVYWRVGYCYEQSGRLDSAQKYLDLALERAKKGNNIVLLPQILNALGRTYQARGENERAFVYFQEANEVTVATGANEEKLDALFSMFTLSKRDGHFDEAIDYIEDFLTLKDSVYNQKNISQFTWLEANQEFEKEKQELAFEQGKKLERERSIQRIFMVALIVAILFVAMIAWFYLRKRRDNEELRAQKEVVESQKQVLEQQKEKLEEQADQLRELDREKSRFFTNISHEFRTPLTVISGMAESIKGHERTKKLIRRNSNNLLDLINQILDLRKLESGKLATNYIQDDIAKYLRYILESFHSLAEAKGIKLTFQAEPETIVMDYDVEKILRIVSNLLSNAIKFTPEGGEVKLKVLSSRFEVLSLKNNLELRTQNLELPSTLVVEVSDTGKGISGEALPHIFDQFYQVDSSSTREGEGTGIGLSLTKELVKLLGGEIGVESKLGKGTSFKIKLPITREAEKKEAERITPQPIPESVPSLVAQTISKSIGENLSSILLVEDNPDVVEYLVSCLEGNYELLIARNGQEGIEKAIEEVPDLIVSDVMMPFKDGFEVCDTLKNHQATSHIPIILLTAKADVESRISGLERGADAYLAKPFNKKELLIRIQKLIELRRSLQLRYASAEPLTESKEVALKQEDAFILRFRQTVEAHLDDESFKYPELAKAIGMSRSQIARKLNALTGHSISHYIRLIRLQKARELIKTTDLTMAEITYSVGFSSPSYFSRCYVAEFGVQPTSERNT